MLSSGIPWNIPPVTCTFWYTHEALCECVYQENTSDEWDIPWLYSGQQGISMHDGKVRCDTVE